MKLRKGWLVIVLSKGTGEVPCSFNDGAAIRAGTKARITAQATMKTTRKSRVCFDVSRRASGLARPVTSSCSRKHDLKKPTTGGSARRGIASIQVRNLSEVNEFGFGAGAAPYRRPNI